MEGWPKLGEGGANKVAYALYCFKQITFEEAGYTEVKICKNQVKNQSGLGKVSVIVYTCPGFV